MAGDQRPFVADVLGEPSLNGHGSPYRAHVHHGADSKSDVDREATRYLSAATQLNLKYARFVVRNVVDESLRGVGLPQVRMWWWLRAGHWQPSGAARCGMPS